jgi:biotin/methionine sulfoxide reductase
MSVRDGRLESVTPFEHDPNPTPLIEAWPEMLTSPMRVAYPVARRGWLAGDQGAARGEDQFVRIAWDRALDLVAGEIGRVRAAHGNQAIFGGSYGWSSAGRVHHARTLIHRFLNSVGGFTGQVTNYSYGAAMAFLPRIAGSGEAIGGALTAWAGITRHADIFLAFGGVAGKNWEVQSGGFGLHQYPTRLRELAESGVRVLNVSPFRGDLPEGYPAEWLAIRPNTDAALVMAMTQSIVAAGRHDRDALVRYCTGFDRYAAYLMGETDGIVKGPAWAAGITGIPAAAIAELAQALPGKRVMLTAAWSLQRARHGEQIYWAIIALAGVLGQIGLPGGGFAFGYGSSNGMGNPRYDTPLSGLPIGTNKVGIAIPVARIADLLLNPGETIRFNGRAITYPDIKLVHWAGGNPFHHHQDLNRLRRAFRKPETVVVQEPFWTSTARHADIVLPATTPLERNDIGGSSRDPFLLAMHQAVAPVGEARNDYDILADLAERLGSREAFTEGRTEGDWLRLVWQRSRDILAKRSIAAPDFDSFWETGFFKVPQPTGEYSVLGAFRADPEAAPLNTESGKIELFSASVAAMEDTEQPGHPVWNDPEEWLGAALADRFPLHLLTPQPARRLHGQMEASSHSRAGKRQDREVMLINLADAAARGIVTGDMVRLFNDRGACLASAEVSDALLAGVVSLPTGAGFDPDGDTLDRSSNPNVLTLDKGTSNLGQGCAAQSCLVQVERYDSPLPDVRIFAPPAISG